MFIPRRYRTCTPERVGEIAAKTVVQLLFTTGKSFTVDGLREKLREFFRQEVRAELRAVAALNDVELITALISCNRQLGLVGLQLRILNGVVSLLTTEVHSKTLAAYLNCSRTRACRRTNRLCSYPMAARTCAICSYT
jgi:hypothetical protein